jgi:hypothetical protein
MALTLFGPANPPIPQPACDPQQLIADRQVHIADLAQWLRARELLVMIALAVLIFSMLYLQLAHTWSRALANLTMLGVIAVVSGVSAWAFWTRALTWTRVQRESCLGEALVSVQAVDLSFSGHLLNPAAWLWGVAADAFLFAVFGTLLGWFGYLVARSAVRL